MFCVDRRVMDVIEYSATCCFAVTWTSAFTVLQWSKLMSEGEIKLILKPYCILRITPKAEKLEASKTVEYHTNNRGHAMLLSTVDVPSTSGKSLSTSAPRFDVVQASNLLYRHYSMNLERGLRYHLHLQTAWAYQAAAWWSQWCIVAANQQTHGVDQSSASWVVKLVPTPVGHPELEQAAAGAMLKLGIHLWTSTVCAAL